MAVAPAPPTSRAPPGVPHTRADAVEPHRYLGAPGARHQPVRPAAVLRALAVHAAGSLAVACPLALAAVGIALCPPTYSIHAAGHVNNLLIGLQVPFAFADSDGRK